MLTPKLLPNLNSFKLVKCCFIIVAIHNIKINKTKKSYTTKLETLTLPLEFLSQYNNIVDVVDFINTYIHHTIYSVNKNKNVIK